MCNLVGMCSRGLADAVDAPGYLERGCCWSLGIIGCGSSLLVARLDRPEVYVSKHRCKSNAFRTFDFDGPKAFSSLNDLLGPVFEIDRRSVLQLYLLFTSFLYGYPGTRNLPIRAADSAKRQIGIRNKTYTFMADALDPNELFGHVADADGFHLPHFFAPENHGHVHIPQPFKLDEPLLEMCTGNELIDNTIQPLDFMITKFMLLELVVAIIIAVCFIGLAKSLKGGTSAKGRLWNFLEVFLLFIRDDVARPCIGKQDADKFMPFLWTIFLFVLGCNLIGMVPWMGSPTGALAVTGALAFVTFSIVVFSGSAKLGVVGFWKAQVPHMDLPGPIAVLLIPMIFVIEVLGLFIKHGVLAIRLLANMMAGHVVLAVIVGFISASAAAGAGIWGAVTLASVLGGTALSLLELFVAFLQAYIFTFLSALFIGAAVHPH